KEQALSRLLKRLTSGLRQLRFRVLSRRETDERKPLWERLNSGATPTSARRHFDRRGDMGYVPRCGPLRHVISSRTNATDCRLLSRRASALRPNTGNAMRSVSLKLRQHS